MVTGRQEHQAKTQKGSRQKEKSKNMQEAKKRQAKTGKYKRLESYGWDGPIVNLAACKWKWTSI